MSAAEPGYSSFQGVRRFAQLAGLRPDAVCFAFGRGDARQARTPDAEYARRLASLGPFSASWLALHTAHAGWAWMAPENAAPRVLPNEFRSQAEAFVERARALGATPILIATGPAEYDAALESVAARARIGVFAGSDGVRLAESLLDSLAAQGIVLSHRRRAAAIELARASDARPELVGAWLEPALRPEAAPGRRFEREGRLELERLSSEQAWRST